MFISVKHQHTLKNAQKNKLRLFSLLKHFGASAGTWFSDTPPPAMYIYSRLMSLQPKQLLSPVFTCSYSSLPASSRTLTRWFSDSLEKRKSTGLSSTQCPASPSVCVHIIRVCLCMHSQDSTEKCEMDNLGLRKAASAASKSLHPLHWQKPCPHWAVMSSLCLRPTLWSSLLAGEEDPSHRTSIPPPLLSHFDQFAFLLPSFHVMPPVLVTSLIWSINWQ